MNKRRIKAMGQHFLKNPFVLGKIVSSISPAKNDLIIEIGAGKGVLTFRLAEKAGKIVAIEKDRALVSILEQKPRENMKILAGDVLKIDFKKLIEKERGLLKTAKIVGNLPYSISSPLLFKLMSERDAFQEAHFLLQLEVAQRICAQEGSKNYAPLSILFQNHFSTKLGFQVGPESFSPPPKVKSALVSLKKRDHPLFSIQNEDAFKRFLRDAFRHRRKTLWNNMCMCQIPIPLLDCAYQKLHLEKKIRPEQVSLSRFVDLFLSLFSGDAEMH